MCRNGAFVLKGTNGWSDWLHLTPLYEVHSCHLVQRMEPLCCYINTVSIWALCPFFSYVQYFLIKYNHFKVIIQYRCIFLSGNTVHMFLLLLWCTTETNSSLFGPCGPGIEAIFPEPCRQHVPHSPRSTRQTELSNKATLTRNQYYI